MTTERHEIILTARDGVSATFKKAGDSAVQASERGQKAARDWDKALTTTGLAVGGLIGVTSKLGQAHAKESQQLKALDRAYGDSADQINDLADDLQSMGIASDDSTRI